MQDPEETRCLFIPRKEAVNLRLMYLFFASLREINYLNGHRIHMSIAQSPMRGLYSEIQFTS